MDLVLPGKPALSVRSSPVSSGAETSDTLGECRDVAVKEKRLGASRFGFMSEEPSG